MKVVTLDNIVGVIRARRGQKEFLHKFIEECEIVNAIPIPDNATNGDVIKAMFPKLESREKAFEIEVNVNKNKIGNVSVKMWNAPYKVESEDK